MVVGPPRQEPGFPCIFTDYSNPQQSLQTVCVVRREPDRTQEIPMKTSLHTFLLLLTVALLPTGGGRPTAAPLPAPNQQSRQNERPRLVAQLGHSTIVNSVAISRDGKFILTSS